MPSFSFEGFRERRRATKGKLFLCCRVKKYILVKREFLCGRKDKNASEKKQLANFFFFSGQKMVSRTWTAREKNSLETRSSLGEKKARRNKSFLNAPRAARERERKYLNGRKRVKKKCEVKEKERKRKST